MSDTVVIQSHRHPLPYSWLPACLQSVKSWAQNNHYDYVFIGDELFDSLSLSILQKTKDQPVIATDLARLLALQFYLKQGYQTVIWCDADFLIFDPDKFLIPDTDFALGREVWIQYDQKNNLKAYRKVHNAFMMFRQGNNFLDFYGDTAERLLNLNTGQMPNQFIGPKLLTALHNLVVCPVMENAGMLSPLVIKDILQGKGVALDLFRLKSKQPLAAANLCCSSCDNNEISELEVGLLIELLFRENLIFQM